jgi:hypothetical protein
MQLISNSSDRFLTRAGNENLTSYRMAVDEIEAAKFTAFNKAQQLSTGYAELQ